METNVLRLLGVGWLFKKEGQETLDQKMSQVLWLSFPGPISNGPTLSQLSITHDEA